LLAGAHFNSVSVDLQRSGGPAAPSLVEMLLGGQPFPPNQDFGYNTIQLQVS
jgi:hypothetical protein